MQARESDRVMIDEQDVAALRGAIAEAERAGALDEADRLHKEYRKLMPGDAAMTARHGKVVFSMGDKARAATITRRALRTAPGDSAITAQLGDIYFDQERFADAEAYYRMAVDADPDNAIALRRLAQIVQTKADGRDEALELLKRVIELVPDDVAGWLQLGAFYANDAATYHDAERAFERALELSPTAPSALHNYGLLKRFQGELEEAERYLKKACVVYPNDSSFAFSLGTCYLFMEDAEKALTWFRRAVELDPDNNAAQVYAAYALFHLGRMAEAWKQYETRLNLNVLKDAKYERPRWKGEDLDGQTLLLLPEQGMGDNIQFVRYARLAAARNVKLIVATQKALVRLFKSIKEAALVTSEIPAPKYFHRYCPLLSLPFVFGTDTETVPSDVPYLKAPEDLVESWRQRLQAYSGFRVGLCWRGNPRHVNDRFRSTSLEAMSCLLDVPGVVFFSLHKTRPDFEAELPEGVVDIGAGFEDFADTAAAMESLDLVISVDTSVCHLAGAIGRPVWTMIARGPDFRWGLEGEATPWYPTMTLYRQQTLGDWLPVYSRMKADLRRLAGA